ncbi:hypothetical protein JVU11DRAFT_6702 [Chiua virens]|nr:hypothetical protein JVU11DRAFT_6702 [Chiua virens]
MGDPDIFRVAILSSAMALVIWDSLLTLDDEVHCIWSKPGRIYVKWIYLFTRWFGLVNQVGIQVWYHLIATFHPVSVTTCKIFFIFEATTFQVLQVCLDVILILRIWAVFQGRWRYVVTALVIVFVEIVVSIMIQVVSIPKSTVDGACMILDTPATTTCFGIAMTVSQTVLLSLTYHGKSLMRSAARRSKIITIVVRDAMLVFGVVTVIPPGITLVAVIYILFDRVVINVFMPWIPVIPTLLTSRMILNMRMAAEPTATGVEFTTIDGISTDEIELSDMERS